MQLHQALAEDLLAAGINEIFGLMGDANMLFVASYKESGGRFVDGVHEGGAVSMADGYARVKQSPSVATVTHGPGMTNAITALTEAVRARTPMVVLCGDIPSRIPEHGQALDLSSVANTTGADYQRSTRAEFALRDLRHALARTAQTSVPVLLNIPVDFMREDVEPLRAPARIIGSGCPAIDVGSEAVDAALGFLASSQRPLILAGRGVAMAGAEKAVLRLAEALSAPVATTLLGRGLFFEHPTNIGLFGGLGTPIGEKTVAAADCILILGAGLNRHTTDSGSLLAGKQIIHCDIDPMNLAYNDQANVQILGDAADVAVLLTKALEAVEIPSRTVHLAGLAAEIADFRPLEGRAELERPGAIDMRLAVAELNRILPMRRRVVSDCGRFQRPVYRHLEVPEPLTFTHAVHFGSIGLGLATAIGASVADPERTTVVIAGDGGTMQTLLELHSAVQLGLPLIVVVLNDASYGAEYEKLNGYGADPTHALYTWPEFAPLAQALGATGRTVRRHADFASVAEDIEAQRFPLLIDVKCDATTDYKAY